MSPREAGLVLAKGFCMGAADVVPGVSGGTMAFILGIYQRLLEAIRSFDLALARMLLRAELGRAARHTDLLFLAVLLAGIFSALMFFTRVVSLPSLLQTHTELVYALFFGLVCASVFVLLAEVPGLKARDAGPVAVGVALGLAVVNLVPVDTPETTWFVFLSGALSICAMILPGISGSFILLILKKYAYVFAAIGRLDLTVIVPFALGAVTGLMVFSRVLVWLLHHHLRVTLLTITGVLAGSLWMLWPFQDRHYEMVGGKARLVASTPAWPHSLDGTVLGAAALMALGLALVAGLHRFANRRADAAHPRSTL